MDPKDTSRILDSVSADFIPPDVNLLPGIEAHFESRSFVHPRRLSLAWAVVLILLALALLTGVVYAVAHSLGFIPGVGLVDLEHAVRVLDKPVSGGNGQITVTVKQVIADSTRTKVTYRVAGIPWVERGRPDCLDYPLLQLPDGQKIEPLVRSGGTGMYGVPGGSLSFEDTLSFPPLSIGENNVYFIPPCEQPRLALDLVPAPAGFAMPAEEIGATFEAFMPASTSAAITPTPDETETATVHTATSMTGGAITDTPTPFATMGASVRSTLHLDKVIELDHSYILVGNFTDRGDLPVTLVYLDADLGGDVQITDAHGKALNFQPRPEVLPDTQASGVIGWAFEIPKPLDGPLTITLTSIPIPDEETTRLQVDAQTGQKWDMNQEVDLGGYKFTIDSLEKTGQGYKLNFHSGPEVSESLSFALEITGSASPTTPEVSANDGTESRMGDRVDYSQTLKYNGAPPAGRLNLALTLYRTVQFPGPWTLNWSPGQDK
jgi:hypothetical protein